MNSETLKYYRDYYQKNKDKYHQKANKKVFCECGRKITYGNTSKHLKTAIHMNLMTSRT